MLTLASYTGSAHLYKQRVDGGHIPLHNSHVVTLSNNPTPVAKKTVALKLLTITMYGERVKVGDQYFFAAIVIGHYERNVHVEKRFIDGMASDDELPPVVHRDPTFLDLQLLPSGS